MEPFVADRVDGTESGKRGRSQDDKDFDSYDGCESSKRPINIRARKKGKKEKEINQTLGSPVSFDSTDAAMPIQEIDGKSVAEADHQRHSGVEFAPHLSCDDNLDGMDEEEKLVDGDYDRKSDKQRSRQAEQSSQIGKLGKIGDEKWDNREFRKNLNESLILVMQRLSSGPFRIGLDEPVLSQIDALSIKGRSKVKSWSKQAKFEDKVYVTPEQLWAKEKELGPNVTSQRAFYYWGPLAWAGTSLEGLRFGDGAVRLTQLERKINSHLMSVGFNIQQYDESVTSYRKKVDKLREEKKKLLKGRTSLRQQRLNIKSILGVVEHIKEESSQGVLTLDSLAENFENLQQLYPNEYKLYGISSIAASYAVPLFKKMFQDWDPLQNPTHGLKQVSKWNTLLEEEDSCDSTDSPYYLLVMEVVYPAVRSAGTNTWDAKVPQPMLQFMESWKSLLPPLVLQAIMDNVVKPQISSAADSATVGFVKTLVPCLPFIGNNVGGFLESLADS